MSTPKLTPVQELRDCLEQAVRAIGESYFVLVAPSTLKRIVAVLKRTENLE